MTDELTASSWIEEFKKKNSIDRFPLEKPLYHYKISDRDFKRLSRILKNVYRAQGKFGSGLSEDQKTCVFIYGATWWRSCYQGGTWSWDAVYESVAGSGVFASDPIRSDIIHYGYRRVTGRSISNLTANTAKYYFGSIIEQGGIPVKVLEDNNSNGIAKAIRAALRSLPQNPLPSDVRNKLRSAGTLPQFYQGSMEDLLIKFIQRISAVSQMDYAHIDPQSMDLPMYIDPDSKGAVLKGLLTTYVKDAKISTMNLAKVVRMLVPSGEERQYRLHTDVVVDIDPRGSYQLEDINRRIRSVVGVEFVPGTVRGTVEVRSSHAPKKIILQYRTTATQVQTSRLSASIAYGDVPPEASFRFEITRAGEGSKAGEILKGGNPLDADVPWVFDENFNLMVQGSVQSRKEFLYVCLPKTAKYTADGTAESLGFLEDGTREILRVQGRLQATISREKFLVKTKTEDDAVYDVELRGEVLDRKTNLPVFFRCPAIIVTKNGRPIPPGDYSVDITPQVRDGIGMYGLCTAKIVSAGKEFSRRLRFFVLPEDASKPVLEPPDKIRGGSAKIRFPNWKLRDASTQTVQAKYRRETLYLENLQDPPRLMDLELSWGDNGAPLTMSLPYPIVRKAFYQNQIPLEEDRAISVRDLFDVYLQVDDYKAQGQTKPRYEVKVEFPGVPAPVKTVTLTPTGIHYELACSELATYITRMFNYVFSGETPEALISLYNGKRREKVALRVLPFDKDVRRVRTEQGDGLAVFDAHMNYHVPCIGLPPFKAIPLTGKQVWPVPIELSHGFNRVPSLLTETGDIWFIYPGESQAYSVNPTVVTGSRFSDSFESNAGRNPLQRELAKQDKTERASRIKGIWSAIATDFKKDAWDTVLYFYEHLWHLPLSALDLWKAVAAKPEYVMAFAAYIAVVRDCEEAENVVNRFADEMGVDVKYLPRSFPSKLSCGLKGFLEKHGYAKEAYGEVLDRVLQILTKFAGDGVIAMLFLLYMQRDGYLPDSLKEKMETSVIRFMTRKRTAPDLDEVYSQFSAAVLPDIDEKAFLKNAEQFRKCYKGDNSRLVIGHLYTERNGRIFLSYVHKGYLAYRDSLPEGLPEDFTELMDPRSKAMEAGYLLAQYLDASLIQLCQKAGHVQSTTRTVPKKTSEQTPAGSAAGVPGGDFPPESPQAQYRSMYRGTSISYMNPRRRYRTS